MKWSAFFRGMGSILDIWPHQSVAPKFGRKILERTDAEALRSDWAAIGIGAEVFTSQDFDELESQMREGRGVPTIPPNDLPVGERSIFKKRQ